MVREFIDSCYIYSSVIIGPAKGRVGREDTVTLTQATSVNCKISTPFFNVMTASYISIPAHSLTPGGFLCGPWATTYGTWAAYVVPGSMTEIDIQFGFSQTAPCYGTIRAQWNNATRTATFTNAILPGLSGPPNCTITGWIFIPSLTIV